jgi:hypothetical protein
MVLLVTVMMLQVTVMVLQVTVMVLERNGYGVTFSMSVSYRV